MPLNAVARRADAPPGPKRDAILRAAIDVFAERGFFNAQVADVARAAGVAAGTVYLYFKSKDDLLVSIFERSMREGLTTGRAAVADLRDPRERLLPPRSRPPGPPRPRPQPGHRLPGGAAAVDQVHGALFRDAAARLPRADPRRDRRRPARRAVPRRHQGDGRGQDAVRRARRDGDQLDPQPAPLFARGRRRRGRRSLHQRARAR